MVDPLGESDRGEVSELLDTYEASAHVNRTNAHVMKPLSESCHELPMREVRGKGRRKRARLTR